MERNHHRLFRNAFFWQKTEPIYQSLDSSKAEFRLLTLRAGRPDDSIRAQINPACLDKAKGNYETISYCWGDPSELSTIRLNERKVSVPASSAAALRCMRLADNDRTLWIDAVCINQTDLEERAQQVAMMADIYSDSAGNLVYLGRINPMIERAIRSIHAIYNDIQRETNDFRDIQHTPLDPNCLGVMFKGDVIRGMDDSALNAFFSIPWFRRVWAFQEAALAPSNTCHSGNLQLDLVLILRVARWIYDYPKACTASLLENQGLQSANEMFRHGDLALGDGRHMGLDSLLFASMHLLTTEPRDHVYGLLGLWVRIRSGLPSSNDFGSIAPDYRKPTMQVYCEATTAALKESRELILFSFISHRCTESFDTLEYPSWTLMIDRPFDVEEDPVSFSANFKADARNSRRLCVPRTSENMLQVSGFVLGSISEVTTTLLLRDWKRYVPAKLWLNNAIAMVKRQCSDQFSYGDIAMTLTAGLNHETNDRTTDNDAHAAMLTFIDSNDPDYEGRFRRDLEYSMNRKLFILEPMLLGLGPKLAEKGDIVVILYGGRVPFVLRPCGEHYRLVGPCYVHGVMDGEAMEKHKADVNPDVEFKIR